MKFLLFFKSELAAAEAAALVIIERSLLQRADALRANQRFVHEHRSRGGRECCRAVAQQTERAAAPLTFRAAVAGRGGDLSLLAPACKVRQSLRTCLMRKEDPRRQAAGRHLKEFCAGRQVLVQYNAGHALIMQQFQLAAIQRSAEIQHKQGLLVVIPDALLCRIQRILQQQGFAVLTFTAEEATAPAQLLPLLAELMLAACFNDEIGPDGLAGLLEYICRSARVSRRAD